MGKKMLLDKEQKICAPAADFPHTGYDERKFVPISQPQRQRPRDGPAAQR